MGENSQVCSRRGGLPERFVSTVDTVGGSCCDLGFSDEREEFLEGYVQSENTGRETQTEQRDPFSTRGPSIPGSEEKEITGRYHNSSCIRPV